MKYGFVLPFGDAKVAAESAVLAEKSGWDGFFVWEPVWGMDAWVSLAAAAMLTEKIRLGTFYDGLLPAILDESGKVSMQPASPQDISEIAQYISERRLDPGAYEIVVEGNTPGENQEQAARIVSDYSDAGATWWIEALWSAEEKEQFTRRIVQGPPK